MSGALDWEVRRPKIRSDETWDEVRRAWEAGETGASLAHRYNVGLANLWRRRASEGWRRLRGEDPPPEPVEGWERHAARAMEAFELKLAETRALAETLAAAMQGGALAGVPLWHAGFVLAWRAERLGAEAAARDREEVTARAGWTAAFWNEAGTLRPTARLDEITLEAKRDAWREDVGLPKGAAEGWP
ncbi:hypothetical protein [Brevundimonas sp. Root1279]|uniref:hypothetical protein n=1 Tax=Brevundimonas sp. Root1279 TaxID=1736443 RepID=UPI0006FF3B64|nr:hypothetical protein [Brevundimonas sp. Root1279]KQW82436.1 hypothetical protein ASC65_09330 [Brevundimonas sp. Root1279]